MTERLGDAVLELRTDDTLLDRGIARAKRQAQALQDRFDQVGRRMARIGGAMTLAITAPLIAFANHAKNAARDAEELQSAFNFSFGSMAAAMNDWAETMGNALGRSTQSLQQQALTFNQLFKAAAPTGEIAAELSQRFTLLANDLSSFFNVAEGDALDKLRAGLVGEAEPLRAFGVFLSEAALEAKALELGLGDATDALTDQQKILLRAAIIFDQTADAQGDLARTAGSTANEERRLQAVFEELSVSIGQKLLPAFTPLVTVLADTIDRFSTLSPEMQTGIIVTAGLAAVMGPATVALGLFTTGLANLSKAVLLSSRSMKLLLVPLILFLSAGGDLEALFGALQERFGGFVEQLGAAVDALGETAGELTEEVAPQFEAFGQAIRDALSGVEIGAGLDDTKAKQKELNDTIAAGNAVLLQTLGPMAAYRNELAELNILLDKAAIGQKEFERAALQSAASVANQYGRLAQNIGQALGTMFEDSKAVAIAQALINTYQAITATLAAYPYPFSAALAASQAAIGFAQVAAIRRTSRGGGGGDTGSVSGGSTSAAPATPQQSVFISLPAQRVFGREQVLDLIKEINSAVGDGARLTVRAG